MAVFGRWEYVVDRAATIAAYRQTELGGADSCVCARCRNFRLARDRVFPSGFRSLLDQLGIDLCKEAEIYGLGEVAPGFDDCSGWFHFVGTLEIAGDFPPVDFGAGFSAWMRHAGAPRLSSLINLPAVQLEFRARMVPWLLKEARP